MSTKAAGLMHKVSRIHFVGIGGTGMNGIAEVVANLGYTVSGSDLSENTAVKRLKKLGVTVHVGHDARWVDGVDVVVTSTAVPANNPEVLAAHDALIPVIPRAEMLAELMRFRQGIAVAGTHGKTTTTSLVASVLAEADMDPTFVIGGKLTSTGANARLGSGQYMVAEADESDASFLLLSPMLSVITNIDADHLETYGGDFEQLKEAFIEFVRKLPFYGLVMVCIDDPVVAELAPSLPRSMVSYGLAEHADIRAANVRYQHGYSHFDLIAPRFGVKQPMPIKLAMPGEHNVLNALAAAAVALELGVSVATLQQAFKGFAGIGRRFERRGVININGVEVELVDDYGHHPRELAATIAAAKNSWPDNRLIVAFQPHRYTRTRDLFDDFCDVLGDADVLLLGEVFAAGEPPIAGADGRALARALRNRGRVEPILVDDIKELDLTLEPIVRKGDILLTLGAGSIGTVATLLTQNYGVKP